MTEKRRSWFFGIFGGRTKKRKPIAAKSRRLVVECLEARRMLTDSTAALLATLTPDPHTTGDQPQSPAALVALSSYTPLPMPFTSSGDPEIEEYLSGMETIESNIESNTAARPAVWGEYVAGAPDQYRLFLNDNGMLINTWSIDWGDGSDPQLVKTQPWLVHQYPTGGQYSIQITAFSGVGSYAEGSSLWTDSVGIGGGSDGLQATVSSVPPTLHVAGPQTVALGATFALDNLVSFSSPDMSKDVNSSGQTTDYSYSIDWGDGSTPFTGGNVQVISAGSTSTPFLAALTSNTPDGPLTHVYTDSGTYDLNVTVTENLSGLSDTQTIPINVVQLAPTIQIDGNPLATYTSDEGTPVSFGASASTALTDPVAYSWQITDSEGSTVFEGTDPNPSYTFTYPDTYTVSLVASVDNVQSPVATATITVNNVAPSFVSSIPNASVSVGQAFNLSTEFTDLNPSDTHTVTVDWGDGSALDTGAQVTEEGTGSSTVTPGTITDSYTYSAQGTYTVTVTLTDAEGLSAPPETFTVDVVAASVALNNFTPSSDGSQLKVSYTVTGATAAPFTIGIYTSPDGSTPDQLLTSVTIDGSTYPLTTGTYTASFTPQFDDVQSNYHLIAVSDAGSTDNTVEFAGGIFYAQSVTVSPPQTLVYVFGTPYYGTGTQPVETVTIENVSGTNTVQFGSASYTDTAGYPVHVRAEGANDTFTGSATAADAATVPLWLFGGAGINTLTGGSSSNLIVDGTGQNTINSDDGTDTPQIVDDSDLQTSGFPINYFHGPGWSSPQAVAGAFNGEELTHSATAGDTAVWTFDNLDPTGYYDVYVTWTPIGGASTAAQYSVLDDSGTLGTPPTVNQTQAPADIEVGGTYWHDLGVYQPATASGLATLYLHLASDTTGEALADAAMIVPYATPPLTNLTMGSFGIDSDGNLSVTYTINGEDSPPFSIGIYQSADGVQPGALAGTIDVSDPNDLAGGGATHTVIYQGSLNGLDGGQYYIAQLDSYDEVEEVTRADNTSAPLTGVYQDGSGDLYVLAANDMSGHSVAISQDPSTGNISVTVDSVTGEPFVDVGEIYIVTYQGVNAINAAGVDLPMTIYGGDGSDTITGGDGGNTIYGGTSGGNTIYAGAGTDTIYGEGGIGGGHNTILGGAGTDTIYAGDGGDTITGGSGNGEIYGGAGTDTLTAGLGNFWIQAGSGNATITGGPSQDWLQAGSGNDFIFGGAGTEKIYGGSGTDYLYGGTGTDDITGGMGTNFIYGYGTHDLLQSGTGQNYIQPNYAYQPNDLGSVEVDSSSGAPTFDGNIDASGNPYTGDYREIDDPPVVSDPGYGGEIDPSYNSGAEWNFTNLDSGVRLGEDTSTPTAVYVTWQPNASPTSGYHWSNEVAYEVLDNGVPLRNNSANYITEVNQSDSPGSDSPEGADRPWLLLGVWNVPASDTLTVVVFNLDSSSYTALCVSDAMIHAIWPTVSIRADLDGTGTFGTLDDYLAACNPVAIPVEGSGSGRVELDLNASISSLYAQIDGDYMTDWQASMGISGGANALEFWSAATGGSPLTLDQVNASIASGNYDGNVWVSLVPNLSSSPGQSPGDAYSLASFDLALNFLDSAIVAQDGAIIPAQQVPTANITRTVVAAPGGQQAGQAPGIVMRFRFTLSHVLPYDVVLVQKVTYQSTVVVISRVGHSNQQHNYMITYYEIIGTIRHGLTQIQGQPVVQGQTVDDTWFDPGNVGTPLSVNDLDNKMNGQIRAFVAPAAPAAGQPALPAWLPVQSGAVPAALVAAQAHTLAALRLFHGPQVWFQGKNMFTSRNRLDPNVPWVTPGTLAGSRTVPAAVWDTDWIGAEVDPAGTGNYAFHQETVKGNPNNPTNRSRELVVPTASPYWPLTQEWEQ